MTFDDTLEASSSLKPKLRDNRGNRPLLFLSKLRETRQCECVLGGAFSFRKIARPVTEISKTFLKMKRYGIIDFGAHTILRQMFKQIISLPWRSDYILVKNMSGIRPNKRQGKLSD